MLNRKDYRKYLVKNKDYQCQGCALINKSKYGYDICLADQDGPFACWEFLENGEERNYIFKLIKKEDK